jgi:hypothetical protein
VDIGKAHHHVAAVDGGGRLVFSRKVDNDERDILAVIAEVGAVGRPVCWAVDVTTGLAALLLTPPPQSSCSDPTAPPETASSTRSSPTCTSASSSR